MHIGLIIKKLIVEKSGMPLVEFANKMGYSEPGMYDIFKKDNKKPTLRGCFFCLMKLGKMTKPMH